MEATPKKVKKVLNIDTCIESDKPAFPIKKHTEQFQNILDEIDEEIDNLEVETNICDVPSSIKQNYGQALGGYQT